MGRYLNYSNKFNYSFLIMQVKQAVHRTKQ